MTNPSYFITPTSLAVWRAIISSSLVLITRTFIQRLFSLHSLYQETARDSSRLARVMHRVEMFFSMWK